jgi:GT2 family glycosyltransferase
MHSLLTRIVRLARKGLVKMRSMVPASLRARLRPLSDWSTALWHRHVNPGFARRIKRYDSATMPEVSVLLITWNRLRMLREGLESLLENTHGDNYEIIVWNNGSTDGTKEYLDDIAATHSEVRVVHHPDNVGLNAQVPQIGYMAANVVQNEFTTGEKDIPEGYTVVDYDGVVLEHGATWGWCSMTSLKVLSRVGNFPRRRGRLNFTEDEDYVRRCLLAGYTPAILQEVVVYHASGAAMNDQYGYLESCLKKYEETPQVTRKLQVAREYAQKAQSGSTAKD